MVIKWVYINLSCSIFVNEIFYSGVLFMKIIVTGAKGFLGARIAKVLEDNHEVFRMGREEANISLYKEVRSYIEKIKPDMVIHCAAIGDIDKCEQDHEKAYSVNVIGTRNIASLCADFDVKLIYISSDQVYNYIDNSSVFREYMELQPLNFYGKTKVLGEKEVKNHVNKHYILRIGWQYGWYEEGLPNSRDGLLEELYQAFKDNKKVMYNSKSNQYITYVYDTIDVIQEIASENIPYGVYNVASINKLNDYETKEYILRKLGTSDLKINGALIEDKNSTTINLRAQPYNLLKVGYEMPTFEIGLERCMENIK